MAMVVHYNCNYAQSLHRLLGRSAWTPNRPNTQGERRSYLPLDSGEVLSGYLSYADYPKQKFSLGCHTSVARGRMQGLQLVLTCAVWVGVTPIHTALGIKNYPNCGSTNVKDAKLSHSPPGDTAFGAKLSLTDLFIGVIGLMITAYGCDAARYSVHRLFRPPELHRVIVDDIATHCCVDVFAFHGPLGHAICDHVACVHPDYGVEYPVLEKLAQVLQVTQYTAIGWDFNVHGRYRGIDT